MNKKLLASVLLIATVTAWTATYAASTDLGSNRGTWVHSQWTSEGRFEVRKMWGRELINLTDAEKVSLKSMTSTQRKDFLKQKEVDSKAKRVIKESITDKLLSWQVLTPDEEIVRQEMIKNRADMKAEKVQMDTIKAILQKKKSWAPLTTDEQAQLTAFKANLPKREGKSMMSRGVNVSPTITHITK